jgi:hypothetical protein
LFYIGSPAIFVVGFPKNFKFCKLSGFFLFAWEFNTVFDLARVRDRLLEVGWRKVHFALVDDLKTPLDEPEKEGHVFVVAGR